MKSYGIGLSLSDSFHLAQDHLIPSMWSLMVRLILFYGRVTFHRLYTHLPYLSSVEGPLGCFHHSSIVDIRTGSYLRPSPRRNLLLPQVSACLCHPRVSPLQTPHHGRPIHPEPHSPWRDSWPHGCAANKSRRSPGAGPPAHSRGHRVRSLAPQDRVGAWARASPRGLLPQTIIWL